MSNEATPPAEMPAEKTYRVKLARATPVLDGRVILRPRDSHVVSEAILEEIRAQGALLDAQPA